MQLYPPPLPLSPSFSLFLSKHTYVYVDVREQQLLIQPTIAVKTLTLTRQIDIVQSAGVAILLRVSLQAVLSVCSTIWHASLQTQEPINE
jgi:hypothetical protein